MTKNDVQSPSVPYRQIQDLLQRNINEYLTARAKETADQNILLANIRDNLREFRMTLESAAGETQQGLPALCRDLYLKNNSSSELSLLFASFFFDLCKDGFFWEETLRLAIAQSEKQNSSAISYNLLLNAEYLGFMNKGAFSELQYLHAVRRPLKNWYQKLYEQRQNIFSSLPVLERGQRRAALILRIWRKPPLYAPALEVLDYAYCLLEKFNFEVRLFNVNLLHDNMPLPFWPPGQFQPLPDVEQEQIKYKDATFTLTHRRGPVFDIDAAQKLWKKLQSFKPEFAIALGDCNLFADILANDIPTVTAHYTSDIPIQTETIAGIQRDMIDSETISSILNPDCQRIFLRPAAVHESVTKNYTRKQFEIPEDSFVFVIIGNRLRSEVTSEFLKNLEKIRKACSNAWFVFVGFYDQGEQQLALIPALRMQTTLIHHVEDVRGFMLIVDMLLNPERAGGGSVAAAAMASGKPVLTLYCGDAAYVVGFAKTFMNIDDYITHAIKLATNRHVYDEWATYCQKRYQELIDRRFNLLAMREAVRSNEETTEPPASRP